MTFFRCYQSCRPRGQHRWLQRQERAGGLVLTFWRRDGRIPPGLDPCRLSDSTLFADLSSRLRKESYERETGFPPAHAALGGVIGVKWVFSISTHQLSTCFSGGQAALVLHDERTELISGQKKMCQINGNNIDNVPSAR